jgi:WD40 repeat protein
VHQYSWPQLERQRTIKAVAPNLHCLAFSPNGQRLAVGGGNPAEDGVVELFSWPAGEPVSVLTEHDDSVMAVGWRNASQLLTASKDRLVKLATLDSGGSPQVFDGHSKGVAAACFIEDGATLITAGDDQSVRVWNANTGKLIRSMSQHTGPVHDLAPRPSASGSSLPMVASAAGDRTIRFWQPTIGRMVRYVKLDSEPLSITWTADGARILASCIDGHVRVVDADRVRVAQDLPMLEGWAYAIARHPTDGGVAVGGSDGQVRRVPLPSNGR